MCLAAQRRTTMPVKGLWQVSCRSQWPGCSCASSCDPACPWLSKRCAAEREKLVAFAGILRSKLAFFEQLDSIAAYLHSPQAAADAAKFLPMLQRLDECIVYAITPDLPSPQCDRCLHC